MSDEKMDQVRELLFGEFEKQTEMRVSALEARLRELEHSIQRRFDALEARLDALSGETEANQRTAVQEISAGLAELSERIGRLSGG